MALTEGAVAPHTGMMDCPGCLVSPGKSKSSLVAWSVAVVALVLAAYLYFTRSGSGTALAGGGSLFLLGALLCPVSMGLMMYFMSRKHH